MIKEIQINESEALELSQFKEMDYFAFKNYALPIELMMENAGLQLANLIVYNSLAKDTKILIGIGNGNNGGGGLVAARRLAAWGFDVSLDLSTEITKPLAKIQLERAIKFGVKTFKEFRPDVWVDAYLGFSQRLPLSNSLLQSIQKANTSDCIRIALDLPTGFLGDLSLPYFQAQKVLTLAAPKKILLQLSNCTIYLADLGIPHEVYTKYGIEMPPFEGNTILKII